MRKIIQAVFTSRDSKYASSLPKLPPRKSGNHEFYVAHCTRFFLYILKKKQFFERL